MIRRAIADDYGRIASAVSDWWGLDVLPGLPRLFLTHFHGTSLVAESDTSMIGFLVGFLSPSNPGEAYIHYVAVDPSHRGGLARRLYDEFIGHAAREGCTVVRAITSPANEQSFAFHRSAGFDVSETIRDYNGPGRNMVTFTRILSTQ